MSTRPAAFIHVDLDTLDEISNYLGVKKEPDTDNYVYKYAIPIYLEIFREIGVKATFFVIGRDVLVKENREIIGQILSEGHEVANHTMNHLFGWSNLSESDIEREITEPEKLFKKYFNYTLKGFRAPSYVINEHVLDLLYSKNYIYDSSSFPSIFIPLMRLYSILFVGKGQNRNSKVFNGSLSHLFGPIYLHKNKIILRSQEEKTIWELPVPTIPFLRIPSNFSMALSVNPIIFQVAFAAYKKRNYPFLFLSHGFDMLGLKENNVPVKYSIHPTFKIPLAKKINLLKSSINKLKQSFEIMLICNYLQDLASPVGSKK